MPLHPVNINQEETTVGEFLTSKGVTGLPALLACGGVVHFTRGGERNDVSDEGHTITRGDFVFVADQCPTGQGQTVNVTVAPTDFAFVVPGDGFGVNARNYLNRRPTTRVITGVNSLDAILNVIESGAQISVPIDDIFIVSHANVGGFLFFKLNNADPDNQINFAELDQYASQATRPQITSRIMRDTANLHIRGCNIGQAQPFLDKLKEIFGGNVTVTAPKFFDFFGFFQRGSTITRFECFLYLFNILSPTAIGSRPQLVDRFRQASFEDFDGNAMPDQWNTWVPRNINANSETVHPCTSPIDPAMTIEREYRHRHRNPLFRYRVTMDAEPPAAQRVDILRSVLAQDPLMQTSHAFPQYKWFGYQSLNDFVDGLSWNCVWNAAAGEMRCAGSRHEYELRIPVTDASNNLLVNALPNAGSRQFQRQDLLETDSRFFGSA
ncbi:MAG: hypothetical protein KJO98_05255 [Rhodothermia bacterium]|nr:hypothetical protein [Rhodothermia bacterium]